MDAIGAIKTAGGWALALSLVFGVSYCSEWPKYRFAQAAEEAGRQIPGARLVSSLRSGDLASPVSWFWPATTTWNFAMPYPTMSDRFYMLSFLYGDEHSPLALLVDADCRTRTLDFYDLDEPDSALPAIDLFGKPVVAPIGKTYRRESVTIPSLPEWVHAFCDTDWSKERAAEFASFKSKSNQ